MIMSCMQPIASLKDESASDELEKYNKYTNCRYLLKKGYYSTLSKIYKSKNLKL